MPDQVGHDMFLSLHWILHCAQDDDCDSLIQLALVQVEQMASQEARVFRVRKR
jgi:hypothetical protein